MFRLTCSQRLVPGVRLGVMTGHLEVRRAGGFIGRAVSGQVPLDPALAAGDARVAEVQSLVAKVDLSPVAVGRRYPDMFTFTFTLHDSGGDAEPVTLTEAQLTPDLHRLVELVLAVQV